MKRHLGITMMLALAACTAPPHAHRIAGTPMVPVASTPAQPVDADVLAAYLRAREVDTHAYLDLDTTPLAGAYAKAALADRINEIETRRREGRPMAVRMEFHPRVTHIGPAMAIVDDDVRNHSVRLDPVTRQPVEADPDELLQDTFTLERLEGRWKVVLTARVGT